MIPLGFIIDDSKVMLQIMASVTIIIYDCNMFIVLHDAPCQYGIWITAVKNFNVQVPTVVRISVKKLNIIFENPSLSCHNVKIKEIQSLND